VAVGTYGNAVFLLDTGANDTVLADWFVSEKQIPLVGQNEKTQGGEIVDAEVTLAKLSTISLGSFDREVGHILVIKSPPAFRKMKIAGIFSPQWFFEKKEFVIDFPKMRIISGEFDSKAFGTKSFVHKIPLVPCGSSATSKFAVSAKLKGVQGHFYISSGSSDGAVSNDFLHRLGNLDRYRPEEEEDDSPRSALRLVKIPFAMGKTSRLIDLKIEPRAVACEVADGRLGADFLKSYALVFSADRSHISFYK
jgi:hypothetical protein